MFMYTDPQPFLDIRYRTAVHYGAEVNTNENVARLARQAAGDKEYLLEPYGTDGDVVFYLERKRAKPKKRTVLFTGTGRCGTMHIADLFTANGIDIGHEICGLDGCSSHFFSYDADWHWFAMGQPVGYIHLGEHRSDYEFEHIIHVVREPLACISSIASFFHDCDWYWLKAQGLPDWLKRNDIRSAMYAYCAMNEKTASQTNWRVQIEDMDEVFPMLLHQLFGRRPMVTKLPKHSNQSPGKPLRVSWDDLDDLDSGLAQKTRELSRAYGYLTE
jgi:hypothetical protein